MQLSTRRVVRCNTTGTADVHCSMDLLEGFSESDLHELVGNDLPMAATSPLFSDAAQEFRSFLCSDSVEYADLRSRWQQLRDESAAAAATALAAAIGARMGVSAAIVAPVVTSLLLSAVRLGCRTICRYLEHGNVVSALH